VPTAIRAVIATHVARYREEIRETFNQSGTWIEGLLLRYSAELNYICASHTISSESSERVSEVEVMLGTNLEITSKPELIERMKRHTNDLADTVRVQLKSKGDEDDSPYNWLARAWKAYLFTSALGEKTFGALSFSWLALDSVLEALQTIDERFLPETGPILPPFASTPSIDQESNLNHHQTDRDNWVWEDVGS
jgi:hypothetical protein